MTKDAIERIDFMKKLRNLILGIVMAITLSACNTTNEMPTVRAEPTPTPIITAYPTEQPISELTVHFIDVGQADAADTETAYIGNKNSKKFHRPNCRTLPTEKNRVPLTSYEDAINSGYTPCRNCFGK